MILLLLKISLFLVVVILFLSLYVYIEKRKEIKELKSKNLKRELDHKEIYTAKDAYIEKLITDAKEIRQMKAGLHREIKKVESENRVIKTERFKLRQELQNKIKQLDAYLKIWEPVGGLASNIERTSKHLEPSKEAIFLINSLPGFIEALDCYMLATNLADRKKAFKMGEKLHLNFYDTEWKKLKDRKK